MKYSNILNLLLAVALVILCAKVTILDGNNQTKDNMDNKTREEAILENIMTRTSIRNYTDENVSKEQIETILKAGMAAPSAGNKQPWRFVVVQDKATKQKITDNIGPAQPAAKAPLLIVVCGDLTQTFPGDGLDYWIEDCSAVCQNMLLAAHAMDLGAVWLGVYPQRERCKFLSELISLPNNIMPLGMIAIGHPAESPEPKDKWKPENVHQETWTGEQVSAEKTAPQWKKVDIADARITTFTLFSNAAALTVGKDGEMNSMTIGWGELGTLWGHDRKVITVFVRQSRFTKHLMDKYGTFTVEAFPDSHSDKLKYLGSASGRNEDKIKGSGLTVKMMENGAPAFDEGNLIIECRKLYAVDYKLDGMDGDVVKQWYSKGEDSGNYHTAYTAEITAVWVKK